MKKLLLIGIGILGLSIAGARAEGTNDAAVPPAKPKIEKKQTPKVDLNVTGVIKKTENKKKDGTLVAVYKLLADDGTSYSLRVPGKKDAPGANIAELVDAKVKIVGKGEAGKHASFSTITSVEKVN